MDRLSLKKEKKEGSVRARHLEFKRAKLGAPSHLVLASISYSTCQGHLVRAARHVRNTNRNTRG